jgi:hypothetical protein
MKLTDFTYPMYFECIADHSDKGMIIKFTDLEKGIFVKEAKNGYHKLNSTSIGVINGFTKHTCNKTWRQVNFDEKLNKIIPDEDDIYDLISDLKSLIEDDDSRFNPSEPGAGTQLKDLAYDECHDIIDEWLEKYHITEAPDIDSEKDFKYFYDLYDVIEYIEYLMSEKHQDAISYLFSEINSKIKHDDNFDALSYERVYWNTGATDVANNLNQQKEFTMTKELQEAILELIATNTQPKVKKPKTAKIVCDVNGELMRFKDEAALKQFMWTSRVESVIRYDLAGKVTVPFELSIETNKKKPRLEIL